MRVDGAAVHLDERPNQRESDAESAVSVIERVSGLDKEVEDRVQHVRRDAGAVVADPDDRRTIAVRSGRQPHAAAPWRVLDGIAQQIDLNLLQAGRIAVHPQRLRREIERELQVPFLGLRSNGISGL